MIADEQQQDEQQDGAMVQGEDFQLPPVVNDDGSEDLSATPMTREKKTLFCVPVGVQDRTVWAWIDRAGRRNLIFKEITKPFHSRLLSPLYER